MMRKKKTEEQKSMSDLSSPSESDYSEKEIIQSDTSTDNPDLFWSAPEFLFHHKSTKWYLAVGSALLLFIAASVFLQQWVGVFIFIFLGIFVFIYAEVKPKEIEIRINDLGINVGDNFYSFDALKSFWIVNDPQNRTLNLETTKKFSPLITIQLLDIDPLEIKKFLKLHILEDPERAEDIIDKFMRFIRF